MADNIVENGQQQVVDNNAAQAIAPEVKEQMEFRLNGILPGEKKEDTQPVIQPEGAATTTVVDQFGVLKEKFGYATPEDAMAEIENLRKLKDSPIADADFENEESLKLFRAFQAGKKQEVYNYLAQETQIDGILSKEVTSETAADYVKLGMKLKYKDLSPQEIDYKFNKQFGMPAKPAQSPDEEPADYQARVDSWQAAVNDRQMELMIEAKLAKPEVANSKKNIVFPEISDDEGYVQYKKMLEEQAKNQETQAKTNAEVQAAYKALAPKAIETKLDFKDEANKIAFQFQYEPDAEGFAKAVEMASDINKFWNMFYNQDGTPDRAKFLDFLYTGLNKDKVIMEAIKQGKNATLKAGIPDNGSGGIVRQIAQTVEMSDLDKQMQLHGVTRR